MRQVLSNRKLNICFIMQSPDLGGAETYALSLLNTFRQDGHTVLVVANKGKFYHEVEENNISAIVIPHILDIMGNYRGLVKSILLLPQMTYFYFKLLKRLKYDGVDVVLMSGFSEKLLVTALAPIFGMPVVWIEYGVLKDVFRRNIGIPKLAYLAVKGIPYRIIVPTQHTLHSLERDAHVFRERLIVIPCGTEIPDGKKPKQKEGFVVGNISRLTREKGQDILIRAFPYVLKKIPQAQLLLAGSGPDKAYFQEMIEKLGIASSVKLVGFVKDSVEFYNKLNIFVFPSVWNLEGFGLVIIEAMAHQAPVIASNIGPVPYIIKNGKTGILVKPEDEKILANEIVHLLQNKTLRDKLAKEGYKTVNKKFSLQKISKEIINILYESTKSR